MFYSHLIFENVVLNCEKNDRKTGRYIVMYANDHGLMTQLYMMSWCLHMFNLKNEKQNGKHVESSSQMSPKKCLHSKLNGTLGYITLHLAYGRFVRDVRILSNRIDDAFFANSFAQENRPNVG